MVASGSTLPAHVMQGQRADSGRSPHRGSAEDLVMRDTVQQGGIPLGNREAFRRATGRHFAGQQGGISLANRNIPST